MLTPPTESPGRATGRRAVLASAASAGLIALTAQLLGQRPPTSVHPEDFGATGSGDDTEAFHRLAQQAALEGRVIDGRGRRYSVDNVVWPSGTRLSNIRLRLNPGDGDDRSPVAIGRPGAVTRDLIFDRVMVDGNRQAQEKVGASGYADGARSGFQFKGAVHDVTLRDCQAINCATDGIMIFSNNQSPADDSYILRNIAISGLLSRGNRRHGLSADGFRGLSIRNSGFMNNGKDLGTGLTPLDGRAGARHGGVAYGRPFDIEDYLVGTGWSDLLIEDSDCRGNVTGALIYSQVSPEEPGFVQRHNVHIARCLFDEPGGGRWDPPLGIAQQVGYSGTRMTFSNVHLVDNQFDQAPLRMSGIDGLVVSGGRVTVTKEDRQPVITTNCQRVQINLT